MKTMGHNTGFLRSLVLVCVLLASCGASLAETSVNEKGKADSDGLVIIENIAGSIEIYGWDKNEVKVEGTLSDEVEGLAFKATGKKTIIKVKYPRNIRSINTGADLVIYVPQESSLEIESISCPVEINKFKGNLSAEVISGNVTLAGDCDEVEISSISGDISIVGDCANLKLESISGKIEANGERGEVSASSITGRITLLYNTFIDLEVESVDSRVLVEGALAKGGKMELESISGNITVVLPEDISAEFSIETFSGSIGEAYGHTAGKVSKYAPGREMEFVVGSGDGRVEISTFSGDIKIKH